MLRKIKLKEIAKRAAVMISRALDTNYRPVRGHSTATWTEFYHFLTSTPCVDKNMDIFWPPLPLILSPDIVIEYPLRLPKVQKILKAWQQIQWNLISWSTLLRSRLKIGCAVCCIAVLHCMEAKSTQLMYYCIWLRIIHMSRRVGYQSI